MKGDVPAKTQTREVNGPEWTDHQTKNSHNMNLLAC